MLAMDRGSMLFAATALFPGIDQPVEGSRSCPQVEQQVESGCLEGRVNGIAAAVAFGEQTEVRVPHDGCHKPLELIVGICSRERRLSCPNAQKRCLGPLELLLYTFPLGLQKIDKIAVLQVACNLAGGCGEAALL